MEQLVSFVIFSRKEMKNKLVLPLHRSLCTGVLLNFGFQNVQLPRTFG